MRRGWPISSESALRLASVLLAILGIGVATYIAIAEAGGGAPACLAGGGGCKTVANSEYSELLGVNVAVIGVGGYVLILICAALPGDLGRMGGFATSLVGFGFSAYLTYLELFVINAVCQWCVASAVLMTVLLIVTATRAIAFAATDPRANRNHERTERQPGGMNQ